jgi:crossover junction endodeoxyribonuclease RuvC
MVIVGIDPGSRITGYGIILTSGNRISVRDYGTITATTNLTMPQRLERIYQGLLEVLERNKPEEAAIEEVFYSKNVKSALVLGQARGVALLALQKFGLPVYEYATRKAKQGIVGYGAASKEQVQFMIKKLFPTVKDDIEEDAADALAMAVCHSHTTQFKKRFSVQA